MSNLNVRLICMSILMRLVIGDRYTVPPARIEVNHPKGFSVSIPDTQGIQLFAFHGNLNSPMEGLEAGQFSADILKHKGGRWTFTDKKHEIKVGDTLYYWLYVQKDAMGYRRDDQKHVFSGEFQFEIYGVYHWFPLCFVVQSTRSSVATIMASTTKQTVATMKLKRPHRHPWMSIIRHSAQRNGQQRIERPTLVDLIRGSHNPDGHMITAMLARHRWR